jgi:phosphinothricin acetyltransferase
VAYDWSVETAIYVARGRGGAGVGAALYAALERELRAQHVVNLGACITAENAGSIGFHRHLGYETVANFAHFGYKFGRWLDVVWMEKTLGEVPDSPDPFIPFSELRR